MSGFDLDCLRGLNECGVVDQATVEKLITYAETLESKIQRVRELVNGHEQVGMNYTFLENLNDALIGADQ